MKELVYQTLIALIRAGVKGESLDESIKAQIDESMLEALYKVSMAQDLAHVVAVALQKENLLPEDTEIGKKFKRQMSVVFYRYNMLTYEIGQIESVLEEHGIKHVLLKGSVLRDYYPEPWMRTSCDIDVLIEEKDIEAAKAIFTEKCGYEYEMTTSHDIAFHDASGRVHIELHYKLIEDDRINKSDEILARVWDVAEPKENCNFAYILPTEMFYFYHISHMAKHFQDGGCGIKPIADLWVIHNRMNYDEGKADKMLVEGEMLDFAAAARNLASIWMDGAEYDDFSKLMESYILYGGVYGNVENRVAFHQVKKGSGFKYALSRIFLSYEELRFHYPVLNKHKWLFPFCQIRRWCKLIFCGGVKRSAHELKANSSISDDEKQQNLYVLTHLGLYKEN